MTTLVPLFLNGSSFILASNKDNHKSLDEFQFRPDPITDYGFSLDE